MKENDTKSRNKGQKRTKNAKTEVKTANTEEIKQDAAVEKKPRKNKRGAIAAAAKNKRIAKWEEPENLVKLEGWARAGLSMEQIAKNMGVSKVTLYKYQDESIYIMNALKKGKEVCDFAVENALYTAAISGNVVAQIFWLKNRMPESWKDKMEQKVEAEVEHEASGVLMLAPRLEEGG